MAKFDWARVDNPLCQGYSLMRETERMLSEVGDKISSTEQESVKAKLADLKGALEAMDGDKTASASDELRRFGTELINASRSNANRYERFKHAQARVVEGTVRDRVQRLNEAFRRDPKRRILMVWSTHRGLKTCLEADVVAWGETSADRPECIVEVKHGSKPGLLMEAIYQLQNLVKNMAASSRDVALVAVRVDGRDPRNAKPTSPDVLKGIQDEEKIQVEPLQLEDLGTLPQPGFYVIELLLTEEDWRGVRIETWRRVRD